MYFHHFVNISFWWWDRWRDRWFDGWWDWWCSWLFVYRWDRWSDVTTLGLGPSFLKIWILIEIGLVVLQQMILKSSYCILTNSLLLPLRKRSGHAFEQTWIPSPNNVLCHVLLILALWFYRRKFLLVVNVISLQVIH